MTPKKLAELKFYCELTEEERHPSTVYKIKVMMAYVSGQQIQFWEPSDKSWHDCITEPAWSWARVEYRIKPED